MRPNISEQEWNKERNKVREMQKVYCQARCIDLVSSYSKFCMQWFCREMYIGLHKSHSQGESLGCAVLYNPAGQERDSSDVNVLNFEIHQVPPDLRSLCSRPTFFLRTCFFES